MKTTVRVLREVHYETEVEVEASHPEDALGKARDLAARPDTVWKQTHEKTHVVVKARHETPPGFRAAQSMSDLD